jgi:hypothetical protein
MTVQIEIAKRADGAGALSCRRDNDSVTWQKQAKHAAHFALPDLAHFAVETTLSCRSGFFGLIADGPDIEDTNGTASRGPRKLTEAEILAVRQVRSALFERWSATADGDKLRPAFEVAAAIR